MSNIMNIFSFSQLLFLIIVFDSTSSVNTLAFSLSFHTEFSHRVFQAVCQPNTYRQRLNGQARGPYRQLLLFWLVLCHLINRLVSANPPTNQPIQLSLSAKQSSDCLAGLCQFSV